MACSRRRTTCAVFRSAPPRRRRTRIAGRTRAARRTPLTPLPFYIVVEKILGPGEQLPSEWPVHGTTGYEFAAAVNNLFVDRRNERALSDLYVRFIRERRERLSFAELAYRSKKQVLHETMSGDINSLGHQLNRFSERNRHFRDFTLYSLISTLKEIIACFPVYRTYVTADRPVSAHDRRFITEAVRNAKRRTPALTTLVFDFIEHLLLQETPIATTEECEERGRFIGKFQQITSPVAAKGIEDTALYIYNRLLSLNEVGSDPTRFGADPAAVHAWLADRQAALAPRAVGLVDARQQARRRRAGTAQRPVGDSRRMEGGGDDVAHVEPAPQDRVGEAARSPIGTRSICSTRPWSDRGHSMPASREARRTGGESRTT